MTSVDPAPIRELAYSLSDGRELDETSEVLGSGGEEEVFGRSGQW